MNKFNSLALALIFVITISCNKTKKAEPLPDEKPVNTDLAKGFPAKGFVVNGYISAQNVVTFYSSGSQYNSASVFATFNDPKKNLSTMLNHYTMQTNSSNGFGNVSVGNLLVDNIQTNKSSSQGFGVLYQSFSSSNFLSQNPRLFTSGNGSFLPFDFSLSFGMPIANSSALTLTNTIYKSQGYTLNFGNNISNFDSLIVVISDNSFNNSFKAKKTLLPGSQSCTFSSSDLSTLYTTSSGQILFYAYNYSNITINSKTYLFELCTKLNYQYVYINN